MEIVKIQTLTPERFAPYGKLIEYDAAADQELFQIQMGFAEAGWRYAVMKVTTTSFHSLNCHPNTVEAFDPVRGVCLLVVAEPLKPHDFEVFLLDRPVYIHQSVWHMVLTLTDYSLVKVVENYEVESVACDLQTEYAFGLHGMRKG